MCERAVDTRMRAQKNINNRVPSAADTMNTPGTPRHGLMSDKTNTTLYLHVLGPKMYKTILLPLPDVQFDCWRCNTMLMKTINTMMSKHLVLRKRHCFYAQPQIVRPPSDYSREISISIHHGIGTSPMGCQSLAAHQNVGSQLPALLNLMYIGEGAGP